MKTIQFLFTNGKPTIVRYGRNKIMELYQFVDEPTLRKMTDIYIEYIESENEKTN